MMEKNLRWLFRSSNLLLIDFASKTRDATGTSKLSHLLQQHSFEYRDRSLTNGKFSSFGRQTLRLLFFRKLPNLRLASLVSIIKGFEENEVAATFIQRLPSSK